MATLITYRSTYQDRILTTEEIVASVNFSNSVVLDRKDNNSDNEMMRTLKHLNSIPQMQSENLMVGSKHYSLIKLIFATNKFTRWVFSQQTRAEAARRITRERSLKAIMGHFIPLHSDIKEDEVRRIFGPPDKTWGIQ